MVKPEIHESPLQGKKILLTRSREDNTSWQRALENLGANIFLYPCIERIPLPEARNLFKTWSPWTHLSACVFTSRPAVHFFMKLCQECEFDLSRLCTLPVYAVGPETAQALHPWVTGPRLPKIEYNAEGLLQCISDDLSKEIWLYPHAQKGRRLLQEGLALRGAQVLDLPLYATQAPKPDTPFPAALDALCFASPSAVQNFCKSNPLPIHTPTFALGPITRDALLQAGISIPHVSREATLDSLIEKMIEVLP